MDTNLSQLRSSAHYKFTSYAYSFFLLRVSLMINEQLSVICRSEEMLILSSRYPNLSITFQSLYDDVNSVVKKYDSEITNYWIDDVPLFELRYFTPDGMKKLIHSAKVVQNEMESRLSARFAVASSTSYLSVPVVVHTEVFLITPNLNGRDADLKLVTSENLSTCLAMQKKCEVFNFRDLFRKHKMKGSPSLHQLLKDLNETVEWYQLGIQLGIPENELLNIRCRNNEVKDCRRKMLSTWLKTSPRPTWAIIINALASIGRRTLAEKMALKYGVPVASSTKSEQVAMPDPAAQKKHDPIQQKLSSRVQQLQSDIESKDMELVVKKQTAIEAQNTRDSARGRLDEVGMQAVKVQTNIAQLSKKFSDTDRQLAMELRRQNLKALQKRPVRKREPFQGASKEIQKLQKELAVIQNKLASEKEKARSLPEQLKQAKKELAEKSARVQELESAQHKLETLLEQQRESVDKLLMQAAVGSDQQHNTEVQYQLVTAKKQLEENKAEVARLKAIISRQDEEVKRLSSELRSREALLQQLLKQLSQSQVTKPDHTQEMKLKEELQRMTKKVSELRKELYRAEDVKQKAQKKMKAAEQKSRRMQEIVKEGIRASSTVPPKRAQKAASKAKLPGPVKDTWEYKIFEKNCAEICDKLATVRLAGSVADKLNAVGIIGKSVTELAHNYGPGITETSRAREIIMALKDKIQLDAQNYHNFREVLLSLGADTETALHYMPEKDPAVHKATIKKSRSPSKDQDPVVNKSSTKKARTPSKDRDPTFHKATTKKARTPSKNQDPAVHKATTKKTRTPSKGQEYAAGQKRFTIRDTQWQRAGDTPDSMWRGAAVSDGRTTYFNSLDSTSVYCYCSEQQLWRRLPDCHSMDSALVMADHMITTVGGRDQEKQPTNCLASLTVEGKNSKWVELFPAMPTPRYCLAAVHIGRNIIAAGGHDGERRLSTVEIVDTDLWQWSSAASLPHPMSGSSITVCEDILYLLGGDDENAHRTLSVFTSSITDLLHQQHETANQPAVWRRAADTPYYWSTAVSVEGQLLAIGGDDEYFKNTSAIFAYDPTSDSWKDMGHMDIPRYRALASVLPSNELIVAGGGGGGTKVEIGTIV